jgi:hypothetical protein
MSCNGFFDGFCASFFSSPRGVPHGLTRELVLQITREFLKFRDSARIRVGTAFGGSEGAASAHLQGALLLQGVDRGPYHKAMGTVWHGVWFTEDLAGIELVGRGLQGRSFCLEKGGKHPFSSIAVPIISKVEHSKVTKRSSLRSDSWFVAFACEF